MRALLLSAGLGTRLRPVTNTIPKCLVPIAGRPLMDYWLDQLISGGVERVLVNTHYLAEPVRDYVANSRFSSYVELVHEEELYGTGGTVLRNADFFNSESFLVAHADNLVSLNFRDFRDAHNGRPSPAETPITMMTFETDTPETCGIVDIDQRGIVTGFYEKVSNPPGNKANGAIYIFEPEIFGFLKKIGRGFIDISTEVIPNFVGRIATYNNDAYLRDIGNVESLKQAELDVLQGRYQQNPEVRT